MVRCAGTRGDAATEAMLTVVRNHGLAQTVVIYKEVGNSDRIVCLVPFLKHMPLLNECATAYVCQNFTCSEPLTDADKLKTILNLLPS